MRIAKIPEEWKLEQSTNDKERALMFIVNALQERYCNVNFIGVEKATDSLSLDQVPNMEMLT